MHMVHAFGVSMVLAHSVSMVYEWYKDDAKLNWHGVCSHGVGMVSEWCLYPTLPLPAFPSFAW
jgi:hypothetical protein